MKIQHFIVGSFPVILSFIVNYTILREVKHNWVIPIVALISYIIGLLYGNLK
jgi:hypothetical protein